MIRVKSFQKSAMLSVAAVLALSFFVPVAMGDTPAENPVPPDQWLVDFKKTALMNGISEETFDMAFADWQPVEKVLYYDRHQPEFSRKFWDYMDRSIPEARIERGRRLLRENRDLLDAVYDKSGVQPRFLVAFWGLESNFGDHTGGFPVIDALATLAHDPRRSEFFTQELLLALKILDQKHIPQDKMLGSWAGAMGQTQFMPSTFTGYAVDGDGDGKKDLWGSLDDVMYSSANYLSQIGWNKEQTWGREVKLPADFDYSLADLDIQKDLSEWQKLGVRRANGTDLPEVTINASLILPAGYKGPAFMVYDNFRKIMIWNRSLLYAIAVGHLADRLQGKEGLAVKPPAHDRPLHRNQVIALQSALKKLGFEAGNPDGILGAKTRAAIKAYQIKHDLPADGYPEALLVQKIIEEANT